MQYLFSFTTADILVWPLRVPRGCRVLSGDDGIYVSTKRPSQTSNASSSIINIPVFSNVGNTVRAALDEFFSFRSIFALLRSPICGRIDIFMRSAYIAKNLTEKGTLPHENELVRVLRAMSYHTSYIPHSVPPSATLESTGLQMEEEELVSTLPRLETCLMPMFKIAEQYWDPKSREFTKFPKAEPKQSPNLSLIYLPVKQPTSLAIPLLKTLSGGIKQQPLEGRRVNCILLLDDKAADIDTRLLTPETLSTLGILIMSTKQYVKWVTPHNFRTIGFDTSPILSAEDSLERRSALFKSGIDFRFNPWPCDYHWKMFACEPSGLDYTVPRAKADWHCLLLNSSALDYAGGNGLLSQHVMDMLRDCDKWPFHMNRIETWQHLDATCTRINPNFKFSVHVHTQEFTIPAEKSIERKLRTLSTDAYFASFGFMWNGTQKQWCEKSFNRIFLKGPGGVLSAEHIEACFEGFMKSSAEKLLEGKNACPICDETANRMLQGCGHMYCINCLRSIQDLNTEPDDKCPECRYDFLEEDIIEIKPQKTRRPRAGTKESQKELVLARQKALKDHFPVEKGPMQIDTDTTCIIVAYNILVDKVKEWAPDTHIASLETLGPRGTNPLMSPMFSKLLLLSPHIPGLYHLESLHEILQSWTTPEFELHVLRLSNGAFSEDMDIISSVAKSYNVKI